MSATAESATQDLLWNDLRAAQDAEGVARQWVDRCFQLLEQARSDLELRERVTADLRSRLKMPAGSSTT